MLSKRTLVFLENLAGLSNAEYPEGGLLFQFNYAYRQAHTRLKGALLVALHEGNTSRYRNIAERDVDELARFVLRTQGEGEDAQPAIAGSPRSTAITLLDYLKDDLQHDLIALRVDEGDYDMSITLEMANTARNDYWRLELFWSVD